ncbi:MAG TPA: non-ribosomal peptide synthetase, partial [Myxococcota bacterium]|nr:non-ribosomal peptide synthetase [Myxococcota bacterium]
MVQNGRDNPAVAWSTQQFDSTNTQPLVLRFEEMARRYVDRTAVVYEQQRLTYGVLDARANQLAHRLRRLGVTSDMPVGVCVDRSIDMVVALVGILKAGGGYLPMDANYPQERMRYMLRDAGVRIMVTLRQHRPRFDGLVDAIHCMEDTVSDESTAPPELNTSLQSLAYVLYTSGSTGTPKGVAITHGNVTRTVCDTEYLPLGPEHVLLQCATLMFDASTFELWGALLNGGCLALYPERVPSARGLQRVIREHGVTTMILTTALFNTIVDEDAAALRGLTHLLLGGEAASADHVRRAQRALPGTTLFNAYGPTECSVFATAFVMSSAVPAEWKTIPIGRPIRNTRVYVLDEKRQPLPAGEVGELYIGGEGVARGYVGQPELTAQRFLDDPFVAGARVYKTGDHVRFLPDGNIDFVSRIDAQVKIRGFRIEMGEIEAALRRNPAVRQAAVMVREDVPGEKRLVAYLVPSGGARPAVPELRKGMLEVLPEYMLPAACVWMDALPLTANGKLDAKALPAPQMQTAAASAPPQSDTEVWLAGLWAKVLGCGAVGVTDNFFALGGNSLLALKVLARMREE